MDSMKHIKKSDICFWILMAVCAVYAGFCFSNTFTGGELSLDKLGEIDRLLMDPLSLEVNEKTPPCIGVFLVFWLMCFGTWYVNAIKRLMPGKEYGTAQWGNIEKFNRANTANCRKYIDDSGNRILSKHIRVSYDTKITQKNNNQVIIGGSGAGKTAFILAPNLLNIYGSNVYTDPKGSLLKDYGSYLVHHGIDVQVLNLCDMDQSMRYNPFQFIRESTDVEKLANNIFTSTAPENYQGGQDPFWDNSATTLLESLMYYIWLECPRIDREERVVSTRTQVDPYGQEYEIPDEKETVYVRLERDFTSLLKLADECNVPVKDDEMSKMDIRMQKLVNESPDGDHHPAVVRYQRCWKGAADTKRSILATLYSRISRFDNPKLLRILSGNDLQLKEMGTEKQISLFIIIPETDTTYNFLPGILYTQLFQQLFDAARASKDNRLPIPVGLWADEFANIPMPSNFENILATARSYNVYISIFLQSLAQLKSKYKDDKWEGIMGNADTLIYLGGNEQSTFKYISEQLGKWTIDKRSTGETLGSHGSSSRNYDVLGRELMSPDEVRMLPNDKEIVLYRSSYPMLDNKLKCWEMEKYQEAKQYGIYEMPEKEEELQLTDLLECKGEHIEQRTFTVDLLDFLRADFFEENGTARNVPEEEVLRELSKPDTRKQIKKQEEGEALQEERENKTRGMDMEKRLNLYNEAKGLFDYLIIPGAVTPDQQAIYHKAQKEKLPDDMIYQLINPRFTKEEMESALKMAVLLFKK